MDRTRYDFMRTLEQNHWWFIGRRAVLRGLLRKYTVDHKLKILEVGCGAGPNFSVLAEYGNVYASEMDETSAHYAREKNIAQKVEVGSLPDRLGFNDDNDFDIIVCGDVLEHVAEDTKSLKKLLERLKPGGILMVFVPAFNFLWSENDDKSMHLRRYTKNDLMKKMNQSGFNIRKIGYFNFFIFPFVYIAIFFKRIFCLKFDELRVGNKYVNSLLSYIFSFESLILPYPELFTTPLPSVLETGR